MPSSSSRSGRRSAQTPEGAASSASSSEESSTITREILTWVQCDKCRKWRRISGTEHLPQRWYCSLNPNQRYNSCDIPAEPESLDMAYTPDSEVAQASPSPLTTTSTATKTEPIAAAATPSREASGPVAARKMYTAEYDRARDMLRKLSDKQLQDLSANYVDWPQLLELFRRTPREEPEASPAWAAPPRKVPKKGETQSRADALNAAAQEYLPPHVARECPAIISMHDREVRVRKMVRESEANLEAARGKSPVVFVMSLGTADSQKDEFRKYLEKTGVVSQLTRVLVGLYEEPDRPSDGIDYVRKYLGAPTGVDIEELRLENEELKRRNEDLQKQVDGLIEQLEAMKQGTEQGE
ncbi:hypothetical protein FOL47_009289 [Perkinsus chesapeaki]|uniref:CW-type domain-containing protein n=1 Tax=Perkinsus chesapeaki TaxID=330153 RepID=A0A7J6L954_PERCH|nr:hypothetical protein FOL47_009289 [Perkinsus chesapeaki]